jgi:trimeric autotransporter adhesin
MHRFVCLALCFLAVVVPLSSPAQTPAITAVPNLVRYGGALKDAQGAPLASSTAGVSFAIYKQQEGGAPLWMETQNITTDGGGNYSVLLGSTTATGLPGDLFSEQEQRWLGVQVQGQPEQPRVLMVSVPYAFKAHDADTLGGKSVSDFVLANSSNSASSQASTGQAAASGNAPAQQSAGKLATSSGATNFSGSTTDQVVGVTQSGTGAGLSASAASNAVVGMATATAGPGYGVRGMSASTNGVGVWGQNTAATGNTVGVNGAVSSPSGIAGVFNNSAGGKIISGQSRGVEKFSVDSNGNIFAAGAINVSGGLSETNNAPSGVGLTGNATNVNGANTGVLGETESINGLGVSGMANNTTGYTAGVYGQSNSNEGWGVYGYEGSPNGQQVIGVEGLVVSTGNYSTGVLGNAYTASGQVFGVHGVTISTGNYSAGVAGNANGASGLVFGVSGNTQSSTQGAAGVNGYANATMGQVYGVSGGTASTTQSSAGVNGYESATTGQVFGINGGTNSTGNYSAGVSGYEGAATGTVFGVSGGTSSTGDGSSGVNGNANGATGQVFGVSGYTSSETNGAAGVIGGANASTGQVYGINGFTNSTTQGAAGVSGYGAASTGQVIGVVGSTNSTTAGATGVSGYEGAATGAVYGVNGGTPSTNGTGVAGAATATSGATVGVYGSSASASGTAGFFNNSAGGTIITGAVNNTAEFQVDGHGNGFFNGNLTVMGTLSKGGGSFKIDDPLDPENKYLSHSFVESPDMMNIYNGLIRLDARGEAWVVLPDYFEALNRDFRYQLTSVGAPQPRLYIAREVKANRFKIAGGKPNAKVSWQLTGIRQDAWANAHRIPTEEEKPAQERGTYLHPELYTGSAPTITPTPCCGTKRPRRTNEQSRPFRAALLSRTKLLSIFGRRNRGYVLLCSSMPFSSFSWQAMQWCVQGTASRRLGLISSPQEMHSPKLPSRMRSSAPSTICSNWRSVLL